MAGDPRMSDNPFQSPSGDARIVGTRGGSLQELKNVAKYQRGVLLCLLAQILGGVGVVFLAPVLPPTALLLYNLALFSLGIISTVFVFLLAIQRLPELGGTRARHPDAGSLHRPGRAADRQRQGDGRTASKRQCASASWAPIPRSCSDCEAGSRRRRRCRRRPAREKRMLRLYVPPCGRPGRRKSV